MKNLIVIFTLLCSVSVFAQKKPLPIKIIEATSRNWVSGASGGRTGTKYTIRVYIRTDKKIEFVNLWIGNENVPFDVEFFNLEIQKKIQQGDTLLLTNNKVNGEPNENAEGKRVPIPYKGAALIETIIDGKARYFIVSSFKPLPSLKGQ